MTSAGILGLPISVLTLGAGCAAIAQEVPISGRNVQYYTSYQLEELPDDNGREVGSYQANGVTLQDDGEISTNFTSGSFDHRNGQGSQHGRVYRTYSDGATIVTSYQGRAFQAADGRRGKGTFQCEKGTGRFENIHCEGEYLTRYLDNEMTVTDWSGIAWFDK